MTSLSTGLFYPGAINSRPARAYIDTLPCGTAAGVSNSLLYQPAEEPQRTGTGPGASNRHSADARPRNRVPPIGAGAQETSCNGQLFPRCLFPAEGAEAARPDLPCGLQPCPPLQIVPRDSPRTYVGVPSDANSGRSTLRQPSAPASSSRAAASTSLWHTHRVSELGGVALSSWARHFSLFLAHHHYDQRPAAPRRWQQRLSNPSPPASFPSACARQPLPVVACLCLIDEVRVRHTRLLRSDTQAISSADVRGPSGWQGRQRRNRRH
ncbi:hypothetical protein B0J12DRAFT_352765 [Macrophomina phaseolina]|uniref:Uncharacterized protein n=1 Tax=Macrophomina phaseolina TaxID=35725 RepID=A0ABQ8FUV2_9PEZI|nr:hypothetical protein B0J12DRAFT_352765 [Macrophomina phaseolina]